MKINSTVSMRVTRVPSKQVFVGELLNIPSQRKCGMNKYKNVKEKISQPQRILHTNCFLSVCNCLMCLKEMARENYSK